ncbi:MAG TPA: hypothetical protein VJ792_08165 [Candidatus Nitrosotalea sp.]|nr:hypothetical protein [Candidatus Nitrosotalea sp.]
MGVRKIAYVVFVLPVVISVILGGYVLSDVLAQPDRQLNFLQFNFAAQSAQVGSKDIRILNLNSSYPLSVPLSFTVRVNNTAFDCGDLYMTIYNVNTEPKQVVAQNAYFSQCFAQANATLPLHEAFSPVINSTGNYQIVADMKDKSYQNEINVTATFSVQ